MIATDRNEVGRVVLVACAYDMYRRAVCVSDVHLVCSVAVDSLWAGVAEVVAADRDASGTCTCCCRLFCFCRARPAQGTDTGRDSS